MTTEDGGNDEAHERQIQGLIALLNEELNTFVEMLSGPDKRPTFCFAITFGPNDEMLTATHSTDMFSLPQMISLAEQSDAMAERVRQSLYRHMLATGEIWKDAMRQAKEQQAPPPKRRKRQ